MILIGLIVARQWKLLGAYAAAAILAVLPLSISSNRIAAPRWHFDLSDRLQHAAGPVPRRPALDRDAGRGADRFGPLAARALAALVVGAAAGLRADPPRHQRHRPGPLIGGPGGGLVRRRAGGPGRRHSRARGAAGGRGPRDGQTRVRRVAAHGGPARRTRAAGAFGRMSERSGCDRGRSSCTARIRAAAARCASCGASCGCATPRPRPCRRRCAAPSSTAR